MAIVINSSRHPQYRIRLSRHPQPGAPIDCNQSSLTLPRLASLAQSAAQYTIQPEEQEQPEAKFFWRGPYFEQNHPFEIRS